MLENTVSYIKGNKRAEGIREQDPRHIFGPKRGESKCVEGFTMSNYIICTVYLIYITYSE